MEAFSELRSRLMERLDSMWESTDEEVMELIDSLIMEEGRMLGLNLGQKSALRQELFCSVRKLDVLQELLEDPGVTEIMVNGWQHIFVEREESSPPGGNILHLRKNWMM